MSRVTLVLLSLLAFPCRREEARPGPADVAVVPTTGGPCEYAEEIATCRADAIERAETGAVVLAHFRVEGGSGRRVVVTITGADLATTRAVLAASGPVRCVLHQETKGSCPPFDCTVDTPKSLGKAPCYAE